MINLGNIEISDLRLGASQVKAVYFGNEQVWGGEEPGPVGDWLCFTAQEAGSTVKLTKVKSALDVNLQTSTNGSSWTPYAVEDVITLANVNDKVYFKAVGSNSVMGSSQSNYNKFVMTGKIAASGNINSLLEEDEETARTISLAGKNYCYNGIFNGCSSLTQAPALPATTLANSCYSLMFWRCTSLTQAPELPATTLAERCYNQMFQQCSSLTQAPELPATTLAERCYNQMFQQCSSLTQAPELPATTLAERCYNQMFQQCTSLTQAPALPATTLADFCYQNMFNGCKALTQAPTLPATTLANICYNGMFSGCSKLTQAPELPATTLTDSCYSSMFENCSSLTQAPALPATTLANSCYSGMFKGCTSLTTAPALPATTLANSCYSGMFSRCTSLTSTPDLPATTLASSCYSYMFDSCSNLASIDVSFTVWDPTNATTSWVYGVASSGTFTCPAELPDTRGASNIPEGWKKTGDLLCFTAEKANSTLHLDKVGSPNAISIETSTDCKTWTDYSWTNNTGDTLTLANVGDKVYFRAKTENQTIGSSNKNYYQFKMTGKIAASGNIQALLKANGSRTDAPAYCYSSMFYNCTSLTTAPKLPATTLANNCYTSMFRYCSSLTSAPELPATTLADYCYQSMFRDCTSLTSAPELPATTLANYCYANIFDKCTSLTSAQAILPATTLAPYCYQSVFSGCSSLTSAPALPATTLANNCYYYMFANCTSLTTAPELPATTLTDSCYANMFQGCSNLASINVSFTTWEPTNATTIWLNNVAATGTFTCPAELPDTRSVSNIPAGWTKVDAA